jgi:hypothetical protein
MNFRTIAVQQKRERDRVLLVALREGAVRSDHYAVGATFNAQGNAIHTLAERGWLVLDETMTAEREMQFRNVRGSWERRDGYRGYAEWFVLSVKGRKEAAKVSL